MKPFLTGSTKYGPISEHSDIDIVMRHDEAFDLREILESIQGIDITKTIEINLNYLSYYINISGLPKINIISVATNKEGKAWEYATEEMCKLQPITDRSERINIFQSFKQSYFDMEDK